MSAKKRISPKLAEILHKIARLNVRCMATPEFRLHEHLRERIFDEFVNAVLEANLRDVKWDIISLSPPDGSVAGDLTILATWTRGVDAKAILKAFVAVSDEIFTLRKLLPLTSDGKIVCQITSPIVTFFFHGICAAKKFIGAHGIRLNSGMVRFLECLDNELRCTAERVRVNRALCAELLNSQTE